MIPAPCCPLSRCFCCQGAATVLSLPFSGLAAMVVTASVPFVSPSWELWWQEPPGLFWPLWWLPLSLGRICLLRILESLQGLLRIFLGLASSAALASSTDTALLNSTLVFIYSLNTYPSKSESTCTFGNHLPARNHIMGAL